ncbi:hypothetical protein D9613_011090 [Agrocybe pediades]|uniref:Uncharacterized protein n=1 Tax=Agrocybe pediades TaxID=84607 RepID=A0A8H4QL13_9AGAR|nr:hypothetical protein D9613_011090 [Agrocybe pediades]
MLSEDYYYPHVQQYSGSLCTAANRRVVQDKEVILYHADGSPIYCPKPRIEVKQDRWNLVQFEQSVASQERNTTFDDKEYHFTGETPFENRHGMQYDFPVQTHASDGASQITGSSAMNRTAKRSAKSVHATQKDSEGSSQLSLLLQPLSAEWQDKNVAGLLNGCSSGLGNADYPENPAAYTPQASSFQITQDQEFTLDAFHSSLYPSYSTPSQHEIQFWSSSSQTSVFEPSYDPSAMYFGNFDHGPSSSGYGDAPLYFQHAYVTSQPEVFYFGRDALL